MKIVPQFSNERDKRVKLLVNSCIMKLDGMGLKSQRKEKVSNRRMKVR